MMYGENGKDLMNAAIFKAELMGECSLANMAISDPFEGIVGVDDETKNIVAFSNEKIVSKSICGGNVFVNLNVMPDIADVQTIEKNGEVKVVTVFFTDNTSEKAVLNDDDSYSLEQGISICITKKLLSDKTCGNGSSVYNKVIKRAMKVMAENNRRANKVAAANEAFKKKMAKLAQKKATKKAKREAAAREEAISIQAEAYLRAMREYKTLRLLNKCV